MEQIVKPILNNYYGAVEVYLRDGKYYLTLEDWSVRYGVEISKELALSIMEYFKVHREVEKLDF